MAELRLAVAGEELGQGDHVKILVEDKETEVFVIHARECTECVAEKTECRSTPVCSSPSRIFITPDDYALLRLKGKV